MSSTTVGFGELQNRFVGLAIAVAITGVIAGALLQFTRRFRNMPAYFRSNFSFFKGKNPKLGIVATVIYYILLFTPLLLLLVWVILLGVNVGANPALPVLFFGLFIAVLFLPSYSFLFYFKVLAMFILFEVAQFLAMGLTSERGDPAFFFSLTALMLTLNSIFVAICLWLIDGTCWSIPSNVPSQIKDQIRKVVKIWKKEDEPPQIINGGLYGAILNLSMAKRVVIIVCSYVFSLVVLLIYSIVGHLTTIFAFQATVNSLAIVTTDVVSLILIFITKKTGFNPIVNAMIAILMRVCIVAFSGFFWFAGYCILYLILMTYIQTLVINKYYPQYEKFPTATVMKTNIFKMPQFAALLLLIMFSGLVFFMGNDNGQTLPIASMTLGDTIYPFWAVGVAVIILSFAIFFYLISMRIIQRARDRVRSTNFYYMGCQPCGEYYFFLLLSYVFIVVLGFYLWSRVGSTIIWASCVFLPWFYQAFIIFYANWKENDYLILGDMDEYNKKLKKRKARQQKIDNMKQSIGRKMEEQGGQMIKESEGMGMQLMEKAQVQANFMVQNYDARSEYSDWRDQMNILQAFKQNRLLPSDKKILLSIPVMVLSLTIYSIVFFFIANRDMTAFTVSVEILVIFLGFIPVKRYFSTFQKPNILQIISLVVGFLLNYAFGILSYVLAWNNSVAYTVVWAIINVFALLAYAAYCLLRDKGLILPTFIVSIASIIVSYGVGVLLIALFNQLVVGIVFLGLAFYYTYGLVVIFIYRRMNNSMPFVLYIVTFAIIVLTCFAIMIYGFVVDNFDDFFGFSVTYLVINLMILAWAIYRIVLDYLDRFERPNFYSAYGSPIYKYDINIKSVRQNLKPMRAWLGGWFMFFIYTLLMLIFLVETDYGVSASQIFLVSFYLTFIYFTTYNLYRAGRVKDLITREIMENAWKDVLSIREKSIGDFLDYDEIEEQLERYKQMKALGRDQAPSAMKINPKDADQDAKGSDQKISQSHQQTKDIDLIIYDLTNKLERAKQNDKILLVDFYTTIIFRCESTRKKKMLEFTNFIRDCADILADAGIAIVLDDTLYDLESVYNQAFQELNALSPMQKIYFNKEMKKYLQRKKQEAKQKEELNNKQTENQLKRQKQLQNRLLNEQDKDDSDLPVDKMKDSPAKFAKLKETITTEYTDPDFRAGNDVLPAESRGECKGWKRPSADSQAILPGNSGMAVRQGMIGDCYLISAIGSLGQQRIKQMVSSPPNGPKGAYMAKFNKFNRDVFVIIDDQFPVYDTSRDNQWLFGRCENEKQLFCNILEKAYAKLFGGYQNIVGGKVALALADMTGGFPEQIQLKEFQQQNTGAIFERMLDFKKAGYLMGAGSPPNAQGDSVQIDGIFQGHAYLVLDVRNLDGNKIIKLRNPHGNESRQSTLDWSDDSPKWTKRLKGLIGEQVVAADGAFWMGLQDFVYCYRALYVCRIFDDSFVKVGPFHGAWRGKSAAGLKSSKGRVSLDDNPHYGIRVTRNCTLFVELTQNELQGGRAKNKIFFMVQRNNGRRIEAPVTSKMAGMSGPAINSRTISKEIQLTADSFPYTFSLMTAIYEAGVEGTFSLSMYCNDKKIQVTEDAEFDP